LVKEEKNKHTPKPKLTPRDEQDKKIPNSLASYRDRIYKARMKALKEEEQINEDGGLTGLAIGAALSPAVGYATNKALEWIDKKRLERVKKRLDREHSAARAHGAGTNAVKKALLKKNWKDDPELSKHSAPKKRLKEEEQIDETSKCNKMKKKDALDPKKRNKEEKSDFDPRRMLAAHNRKKAQVNEWNGTRWAKRMYSGDAPPKSSDKPHKSPAMQRALDKISAAYSPDNVKKMISDKKAMQKKPKLDEVSKGLLGRYIKKASDDRAENQARGTAYLDRVMGKNKTKVSKAEHEKDRQGIRKSMNRRNGIRKAVDKLTK
jgi:hypothetical protein